MNWELSTTGNGMGLAAQYTFKLDEMSPSGILVGPSMLEFSKIAVEVVCVEATGASGSVTVYESNVKGTLDNAYTTAVTVATGVNVSNIGKYMDFLSEFVVLDLSSLTLGTSGTMTIRIIAKS